ncbi:MAG TPA: URC4/urg3 family protein [Polyangiaceae bacterium]|nr:URC4/urg3 family protein [Polyangiaceae bacterium]
MAELEVDAQELAAYDYLLTPAAVRDRAGAILEAARHGTLAHFRCSETLLPAIAERVIAVTRQLYPDPRAIPYHGRYRHFDVGGVPRLAQFLGSLEGSSNEEKLRAKSELVITSVLLDAGAGPTWQYREGEQTFARSEGLAVASFHLFLSGALSSDGSVRADAEGLGRFDAVALARAFQVTPENPLTGLEGRAHLLARLGEVVRSTPAYFESESPRLGDLAVGLLRSASAGKLRASAVLSAVLRALGPIWPGREILAKKPLGDVWRHERFGLVPFHKLSQWLSYSLLEPLEAAGLVIEGTGELTGLPEYRNGGLFLDGGVLELKDPSASSVAHPVDSELVIEWRALTVALLDALATEVQTKLGLSPEELPLARVLEGGSWRAGRLLAREKRSDGGPPLQIQSDGTVF